MDGTWRTFSESLLALAICAITASARAQAPAAPAIAAPLVSSAPFRSLGAVIELSDGRVIVNDPEARRLVRLDAQLAHPEVLLDSAHAGDAPRYGSSSAVLLAWRADTLLFGDKGSDATLWLTPEGRIHRIEASRLRGGVNALEPGVGGYPTIDSVGRVVFRGGLIRVRDDSMMQRSGLVTWIADSTPLLRTSLLTGTRDTLGYVHMPGAKMFIKQRPGREPTVAAYIRGPRAFDAWAMRPDGSVVIVGGQMLDVRVIAPDGTIYTRPRIPFPWTRLSDSAKTAILEAAVPKVSANASPDRPSMSIEVEPIDSMPGYYPAILESGGRSDPTGRVWVRLTAKADDDSPVYAVIEPSGDFKEFVYLPAGTAIAGFARDGSLFLGAGGGSGAGGVTLSRHRVESLRRVARLPSGNP